MSYEAARTILVSAIEALTPSDIRRGTGRKFRHVARREFEGGAQTLDRTFAAWARRRARIGHAAQAGTYYRTTVEVSIHYEPTESVTADDVRMGEDFETIAAALDVLDDQGAAIESIVSSGDERSSADQGDDSLTFLVTIRHT